MSRRIVPATFWLGMLICASLLLADTMRASGPANRASDVQGVWDGFFLTAEGGTGLVQSDTVAQANRRIAGSAVLLDPEGRSLFNTMNFNATLARDDFLTGTGVTLTGRLVFQADLMTFPGLGGAAGVLTPEYHLVPSPGGDNRISSLLLHPFPSASAPDLAGTYAGPDPVFGGIVNLQFSPRNARGSFPGRLQLFSNPNLPPVISWPSLGTTSDDRRVTWIAQGLTGRVVYDGVVVPGSTQSPTRVDGIFRLSFTDGRNLFNAWNVALSPGIE